MSGVSGANEGQMAAACKFMPWDVHGSRVMDEFGDLKQRAAQMTAIGAPSATMLRVGPGLETSIHRNSALL
jgi:hypothetical protein